MRHGNTFSVKVQLTEQVWEKRITHPYNKVIGFFSFKSLLTLEILKLFPLHNFNRLALTQKVQYAVMNTNTTQQPSVDLRGRLQYEDVKARQEILTVKEQVLYET